MDRFVQLHLLRIFPPSCVNRDDTGRPKTAYVGQVERLRISSQCDKRAWRESDAFQSRLKGSLSERTRWVGENAYESLIAKGVKSEDAEKWAKMIMGALWKKSTKSSGDKKGKKKKAAKDGERELLRMEQLLFLSPDELKAIDDLINRLAKTGEDPSKEELMLLRRESRSADLAMFGRMIADMPEYQVEGAVHVSHSTTVHAGIVEEDYVVGVDDNNKKRAASGAAYMGEQGFGSGIFYTHICIDRELLISNLCGDKDLAQRSIAALLEAAATVAPKGKQNSFGSHVCASYILAEKGQQQPRTLSAAFLKPVSSNNLLDDSVERIENLVANLDQVFGPQANDRTKLNVFAGEGNLKDLTDFICE